MPTNITTIPGAEPVLIYLRNYSYATAVSGQPAGTINFEPTMKTLLVRDFGSDLHKVLMDASTTAMTPQYRIFFADESGRAKSDSHLTTDSTGNLHFRYAAGKIHQDDNLHMELRTDGTSIIYSGLGVNTAPFCALDVAHGGLTALFGAQANSALRGDGVTKYTRIGSHHYTNSEEPVGLLYCVSDGSQNLVAVGGGSSQLNSATEIKFYTRPEVDFQSGSIRMVIKSDGKVGINTNSPTSNLHVTGLPVYADNTAALAGGLTAGSFYRTSTGVLMVVF